MLKKMIERKKLLVAGIEIIVFLVCTLFSVLTYTKTEITFIDEEMQLQDIDGNFARGGAFRHILC